MIFASKLRSRLSPRPQQQPPAPRFIRRSSSSPLSRHEVAFESLEPILPRLRLPSMPVCRFFQQGYCKFGSSCRFQHPSRNQSQPSQPSQPNRFSPLSGSGGRGNQDSVLEKYSISSAAITKDLTEDKPTWILSAYAPGRDAPEQLFGGFPREQSFEEVRLHYMMGKASGNEQQALGEAQALYTTAQEQMERALNNIQEAMRFVADAEDRHPNRNDICRQATHGAPFGEFLVGKRPKSTADSSIPSNPFATMPGPSQLAGGAAANPFGQPSPAKPNPFAQASPSPFAPQGAANGGQAGGFGQAAQPSVSTFGQPTSLGAKPNPFASSSAAPTNAFGVPAQLGQKPNPFANHGQANSTTSPFASIPSSGDNSRNPFGAPAPSQTDAPVNPFASNQNNNSAGGAFGASPFATAASTTAAATVQTGNSFATHAGPPPPYEANRPFGQPEPPKANGVFSKPSTDASNNKTPFGQQPPVNASSGIGNHPPLESYSTKGPTGRLATFKGKTVVYKDGEAGTRGFDGTWARIWFPEGPPAPCRDTLLPPSEYDARSRKQWEAFAETGNFVGGIMPEVPPPRELTRWDF
ncbi:hypothetical protein CDD80_4028 [Ophiocordyceps camponoti-rufipedis]|uniref:C3H1-type domain-containing protein n=1 Tax=Ophiocordyceps camponoti-rufipedis TaxID=2004952 RepID=A0A2C5XI09_9HYPO|nr:hypothetical protein CDD80_4028 [Ophiocordyceps camponoti-rufipedis]